MNQPKAYPEPFQKSKMERFAKFYIAKFYIGFILPFLNERNTMSKLTH